MTLDYPFPGSGFLFRLYQELFSFPLLLGLSGGVDDEEMLGVAEDPI